MATRTTRLVHSFFSGHEKWCKIPLPTFKKSEEDLFLFGLTHLPFEGDHMQIWIAPKLAKTGPNFWKIPKKEWGEYFYLTPEEKCLHGQVTRFLFNKKGEIQFFFKEDELSDGYFMATSWEDRCNHCGKVLGSGVFSGKF